MSADKIVRGMGKIGVFLSHNVHEIEKRGTRFKQVSTIIVQGITEIFVFQQPPICILNLYKGYYLISMMPC